MGKRYLRIDVLSAAKARTRQALEASDRTYLSFSGGKDSTVMLHLVMEQAIEMGRRVGVLFIDLEGQYKITINHIIRCLDLYRPHIDEYWVALPLNLRNAVSQYEPHWMCWEPGREADWIREPPKRAIVDQGRFPFFRRGMEFEEFTPAFADWYADGRTTACFVGIRSQESINRWRTLASKEKTRFHDDWCWTTKVGNCGAFNAYPIYDWRTEDIWIYHSRNPSLPMNPLYDLMHRAGVSIHDQRICQPYGDDQRKGLWLYHVLEPETWARVVARVNGANQGALYARETGNVLGRIKISRPAGHSWESFANLLLDSMPERAGEHYRNKIAKFICWWTYRGYQSGIGIPDESDPNLEAQKKVPSWRRICKSLLRNDYWCKGLSFAQQNRNEASYARYLSIMREKRGEWGIFSPRPNGATIKQLALLSALVGGNSPADAHKAIQQALGCNGYEARSASRAEASKAIEILKRQHNEQ